MHRRSREWNEHQLGLDLWHITRQRFQLTITGRTVDTIVTEQTQSEACRKQGMVSIVKAQENVVTSVLCICAQTITIGMNCVYSATKSQCSAELTVCKHSLEDTASQHHAADTVSKHGRQKGA